MLLRRSENDITRENTITAAILGELVPALQYAAPVLLERSDRGDPLVETTSPTDLGFETSAVDSVLLEFFQALVPYVRAALECGVLGVIQTWLLVDRQARHHVELVGTLNALIQENAKLRQTVQTIAQLLARRDGMPVSREDVVEWIAAATDRVSEADSDLGAE
ncbi:MAG TPA: hypothetical protein VFN10_02170 [Thermoanaerobaculia bacterium]|nr:hypothetical protein [Thermoanaerobaculia bacterium]